MSKTPKTIFINEVSSNKGLCIEHNVLRILIILIVLFALCLGIWFYNKTRA